MGEYIAMKSKANNKKLAFYKKHRKQGLTDEEIRKLWVESQEEEVVGAKNH